MVEKLEGPVTVGQQGVAQETVISSTGIMVGRTVSARRRTRGSARGLTLPGGVSIDGISDVVAGDNTPVAADANVDVGDRGNAGGITVRDEDDRPVIVLDGRSGLVSLGTGKGAAGQLMLRASTNGPVILATGKDGRITFMDKLLKRTLVIDGLRGDIELIGADCAEDFEMAEAAAPGSVLTVDERGRLQPCRTPYDRRVVGVVSGAGGLRPALRLGRTGEDKTHQPIALIGRVYCLVDADPAPIDVGSLLTTSSSEGHAMRATDSTRAFGAVLGKSLGSLDQGRGLLPVLVSLQ